MASLLVLAAAGFIAAHHPLWPVAAPLALAAWGLLAYRLPRAWLFAVPAALPALNVSPWTGWIGVEEFDLLLLGAVAAGYMRLAVHAQERAPPMAGRAWAAVLAIAVLTGFGLWRGVADAGGWPLGWFQGYAEPLNSLRIAKSAVHVLLLLPLLRSAWQADGDWAFRPFAMGMLAGAAVVTLAVLWERAAFPGLFDMSAPYRTTALFWEMHVGGAAIDAYVVLCTPFVAWSLWAAHARWQWIAAALFSMLWAYVCLTTFSRGAYLGVAVALMVLAATLPAAGGRRWWPLLRTLVFALGAAVLLALVLEGWGYGAAALALLALAAAVWLGWRGRSGRRHRTLAASLLALALIFEAVVMLGPDSFMSSRVARSVADYESRSAHWRRGIGLLQGPEAWWFGLGLGRLPAHYDRIAPRGEFSGEARWQGADAGSGAVSLAGPRSRWGLGGLHGLTQRVPLVPGYRIRFDVSTERGADVLVRVCESHLLYDRACQVARVRAAPTGTAEWRTYQVALEGEPLSAGHWWAPRQGVLTLSVLGAGSSAIFDNIVLEASSGQALLVNGDFSAGLAHWLPAAQFYFLPWHIDNLYLELLIERGIVGALLLLGLTAAVLWRQVRLASQGDALAPFIAAALSGVLCLGLVSSVLDVPRVALSLALLLTLGLVRVK